MGHYRGQKALYEAMSRASNRARTRTKDESVSPAPAKAPTESSQAGNTKINWRPKSLQCHSGRVELTLPYSVVAGASLILLLALVASFRLGQYAQPIPALMSTDTRAPRDPATRSPERLPVQTANADTQGPSQPVPSESGSNPQTTQVRPGSAIVIQEYHLLKDLIPVREFFNHNDIGTEIVRTDKGFLLITVQRFSEMMLQKGSEADKLRQRIVELGKLYKAPPRLESFAPGRFRGAYLKPFDEGYKGEIVHVD